MAEKVGGIYYDVTMDTSKLIDAQRQVGKNMGEMERIGVSSLNAIALAVKVLTVAMTALKSAMAADDMRQLATRVNVAAGSVEKGTEAMRALEDIARRTGSAVKDNVDVFARLNQSMLQLGGTQQDTLKVTELVGKAIKLSGASSQEASSAILQFGQALGSGKLSGDELRSLLETAPYLMRQLADGMGVPIGALRKLGEEGRLTSDVVVNALSKAAEQINSDFSQIGSTVASATTVALDAAGRLNEKLDTLTGTSAVLTGVTKGLGEGMDMLSGAISGADLAAANTNRAGHIEAWANRSTLTLSYLADAADVVWQTVSTLGRNVAFVFQGIGTEIGGIGAQIAAVMRGDFAGAKAIGDAMRSDADARRKELEAKDAEALSKRRTWGQKMRLEMTALESTPQPDRLDMAARGNGKTSTLKPTTTTATTGTKKPFDQAGYLASLQAKAADVWKRIDIDEAEALRKNDQRLKAKEISESTHAAAIKAIREAAASERKNLEHGELDELIGRIEEEERYREEALRNQRQRDAWRLQAEQTIAGQNPIDAIRFEEEQRLAIFEQYRLKDLENTQIYEDAKLAIKQDSANKIKSVEDDLREKEQAVLSAQIMAYSGMFGSIADLTAAFGDKQSSTYKAMFAVSKAFAIADSIVKIQQGIAGAAALPFPANIPAIGSVIAATSGIISTISGANFAGGRRYGGPVSSGNMYRVNEAGAPEMFTASTGAQYMMPTKNGKVTAANKIGGGDVQWSIVVNNSTQGTTANASIDQQSRTVTIAVQEVASQISSNSGPVWSAMRSATNVQPRM